MQILMVSDVHYSKKPFRGKDQSQVFDWLYGTVKKQKPNLLLSAGDFGEESISELFAPILERVYVLTIFGNHDDIEMMRTLRNNDGSPCLL